LKGGPGASGRVLPPVTGRSRVRVAVSSHCTGEGKACHWHPSPDPAQSGSSLHWVRPFIVGLSLVITGYHYLRFIWEMNTLVSTAYSFNLLGLMIPDLILLLLLYTIFLNLFTFTRCNSYERAQKKLTILEAPNILTIALKRYQVPLTLLGYFLHSWRIMRYC